MPKVVKPLTVAQVKAIKSNGWHAVGGVTGLYLQVQSDSARSWILRTVINGRRKVIGLGSYSSVSLSQAREEAFRRLNLIRTGNVEAALGQSQTIPSMTFKYCASEFIASRKSAWSSPKSVSQWTNTLDTYVLPLIGELNPAEITVQHIVQILKPHWETKTDTMTKIRGRIESIIDWAITYGYRSEANPARWKGTLEHLLPAPSKISKPTHHRSVHYSDAPDYYKLINNSEGMGALCLSLIILTAVRSSEARLATWSEIDLEAGIWTISADRMKMRRKFEVPLSNSAVSLIDRIPRQVNSNLVFYGAKGRPLSDMTVLQVLRRLNIPCVVHGFRSTFSTWVAEQTEFPREIREMSLAHKIGSDVELAYMRGPLLEKRRQLMETWGSYLLGDSVAVK
jgi:integrase